MLSIQPSASLSTEEELGSVAVDTIKIRGFFSFQLANNLKIKHINSRVGSSIGHTKDTGSGVLELEVLILELGSVDGFSYYMKR